MTSLFSPYFSSNEVEVKKEMNFFATTDNTTGFAHAYSDGGTNMNVYDDLEALESGDAREFIPYNFMLPSKDWSLCKVYRKSQIEFIMVLEPSDGKQSSEKFMLSAKRVGDDFYISQYEKFATETTKDVVPKSRYCAILKAGALTTKKQITWQLVPACLGNNTPSSSCSSSSIGCASSLASITRGKFRQPTSGNDIACMDVKLPHCSGEGGGGLSSVGSTSDGSDLSEEEEERIIHEMNDSAGGKGNVYVWDVNRTKKWGRDASLTRYGDITSALTQRSLSASSASTSSVSSLDTSTSTSRSSSRTTSPISSHQRCLSDGSGSSYSSYQSNKPKNSSVGQAPIERLPVSIASQIPVWDSHRRTFMMKFLRNRIKISSNKNFVFFRSELVRSVGGNKQSSSWQAGCEVFSRDAVLQFGKYDQDCYTLDFRKPVAPLHAFALALSTFPTTV